MKAKVPPDPVPNYLTLGATLRCSDFSAASTLEEACRLIAHEPEGTDRHVAIIVIAARKLGFSHQPKEFSVNHAMTSAVQDFCSTMLNNASYMPSPAQLLHAADGIDIEDVARRVEFLERVRHGLNNEADRAQPQVAAVLRAAFPHSRVQSLLVSVRARLLIPLIAHAMICAGALLWAVISQTSTSIWVITGVAVMLPIFTWIGIRIAENAAIVRYQNFLEDSLGRLRPSLERFSRLSAALLMEQLTVRVVIESRLRPQLRTECERRLAALASGWKELIVAGNAGAIDIDGAILIARRLELSYQWVDLTLLRARRALSLNEPEEALKDIVSALEQGKPVEPNGVPRVLSATENMYSAGIAQGLQIRAMALIRQSERMIDVDPDLAAQLSAGSMESIGLADTELRQAEMTDFERAAQLEELERVRETAKAASIAIERKIQSQIDAQASAVATMSLPATLGGALIENDATKDFFISYNHKDRKWAEWIAWNLEEAGYSTISQTWDFRPGSDFVMEMQKAATGTRKTIAVLSDNYLSAEYTQPEWGNAFGRDPQGNARTLIPVRVAKCRPSGLLATRVFVDLVGLSEREARGVLIEALDNRGKPKASPVFPGSTLDEPDTPPDIESQKTFPADGSIVLAIWREKLEFLQGQEPLITAADQKFSLRKQIEEAQRRIDEFSACQ